MIASATFYRATFASLSDAEVIEALKGRDVLQNSDRSKRVGTVKDVHPSDAHVIVDIEMPDDTEPGPLFIDRPLDRLHVSFKVA